MMKFRSFVLAVLFLALILLFGSGSEARTYALVTPDRAAFSCSTVSEIPRAECEALVALYNGTSGPQWANRQGWLQTNTPCSWYGVNCQMILGKVTHVMLADNNLKGTIPTELSSLSLWWLDLSDNQLTGGIPASIAAADFGQLVLRNNQLTGAIPAEIGVSKGMMALDVSHNNLSGNLPDALGQMAGLGVLNVSHNSFYGSLPLNLKNLNLAFLNYEATGLCEPDDADFQAWLAGIRTLRSNGRKCGNRAWTVMYFLAEDNDLTGLGHLNYQLGTLDGARSNTNIDITVFNDGYKTEAEYIGFGVDKNNDVVEKKVELSTGDPDVLSDFIQWSQLQYPADNYALVLYDHSSGVTGFGFDEHPGNDSSDCRAGEVCLTFRELQHALTPIPQLDVIYIEACSSATTEVAYELRGQADYLVASQQIAWGPTDHSSVLLGIDETTSGVELATGWAQNYYKIYKDITDNNVDGRPGTISVVDLSKIENVANGIDNLAGLLAANMQANHETITSILEDVQHHDSDGDFDIDTDDEFVDLYHFSLLVNERINDAATQNSTQALIATLNEYHVWSRYWSGSFVKPKDPCILSWKCDWELGNSYGSSIFFPHFSRSFYEDGWLDFTNGVIWDLFASANELNADSVNVIGWGPMLVEYVRAANPGHADDPNPPPLQSLLNNLTYTYLPIIQK